MKTKIVDLTDRFVSIVPLFVKYYELLQWIQQETDHLHSHKKRTRRYRAKAPENATQKLKPPRNSAQNLSFPTLVCLKSKLINRS